MTISQQHALKKKKKFKTVKLREELSLKENLRKYLKKKMVVLDNAAEKLNLRYLIQNNLGWKGIEYEYTSIKEQLKEGYQEEKVIYCVTCSISIWNEIFEVQLTLFYHDQSCLFFHQWILWSYSLSTSSWL